MHAPKQNPSMGSVETMASTHNPIISYYKANSSIKFRHSKFNKALLPLPLEVLARIGITPNVANNAGYLLIRCPFHKGGQEKNASLSMHQVNGNFRCFACGVKGGDVLAFWMQHTGQSFKQAAQDLGAWNGGVL